MKLYLVDINRDLIDAWAEEFKECANVYIQSGNILDLAENTIVSPANGYGFMDGGLDRQYTDFFGLRPQEEVQKRISQRTEGYLPVGSAIFVKTGNKKIPYMISAPTMIGPGPVGKENCFFAMSALLKEADRHSKYITKIFCPGLATGIGHVAPEDSAIEMANAYKKWLKRSDVLSQRRKDRRE
jgi:O-acetyl-ADP-ribose deacetylase (regulator of RNase III)